eukprot:TRINITY_DN816_c0_g2_i1.p1 TRINITY_DN816_c0_g2~~TRINITY_DN816_c0_g2_i1.p1  ORF type:complete len:602 (-),score=146.06 TRINITY_DN816_c0_g2_i1:165-1970(-)
MPTPRGAGCGPSSPCYGSQQVTRDLISQNRFLSSDRGSADPRLEQLQSSLERQEMWVKDHISSLEKQVEDISRNLTEYLRGHNSANIGQQLDCLHQVLASSSSKLDKSPTSNNTVSVKRMNELKDMFARFELKVGKFGSLAPQELCIICANGLQVDEVQKMLGGMQSTATISEEIGDMTAAMDFKMFTKIMEDPPPEAVKLRDAFLFQDNLEMKNLMTTTNTAKERGVSPQFALMLEICPAIVILINAVVLGVSADVAPTSVVWQVFEIVFALLFTLEAVVKIRVFGRGSYFCGPDRPWNWFDVMCIMLAYIDLSIAYIIVPFIGAEGVDLNSLAFFKMVRLLRLTRLIRLLRFKFFAELKMMILGVFSGIRTLFWAIILLMVIVYLVGVVMKKTVGTDHPEFASVMNAMFTVFRCFTDGCAAYDGTPLQERLYVDYGYFFVLAYSLVYLFITFGLFNLIMAIFIDNVVSAQLDKKRKELGESSKKTRFLIEEMITRLTERDSKGASEDIPKEMFQYWLEDEEFVQTLEDAGIDTSAKFEMFDVLDSNMNRSLQYTEIVDGLMQLRGDVTKTDIIAVRMKVRFMTKLLEDMAGAMHVAVPD